MEFQGIVFIALFFGASWVVSKIIGLGQDSGTGMDRGIEEIGTPIPALSGKTVDEQSALDSMLEPPIFDVMNLDTWQTNDAVTGRNYLE